MRYETVKARYWLNQRTLATASVYGAHPGNGADDSDWQIVENGWTIRDNVAGTVGMSRQPFETQQEAQFFIASRPQIFRQRIV